jgi:hypothetical protein
MLEKTSGKRKEEQIMSMVVHTILYTVCIVFAITAIGFGIGKTNKFGDSDELIDLDKED